MVLDADKAGKADGPETLATYDPGPYLVEAMKNLRTGLQSDLEGYSQTFLKYIDTQVAHKFHHISSPLYLHERILLNADHGRCDQERDDVIAQIKSHNENLTEHAHQLAVFSEAFQLDRGIYIEMLQSLVQCIETMLTPATEGGATLALRSLQTSHEDLVKDYARVEVDLEELQKIYKSDEQLFRDTINAQVTLKDKYKAEIDALAAENRRLHVLLLGRDEPLGPIEPPSFANGPKDPATTSDNLPSKTSTAAVDRVPSAPTGKVALVRAMSPKTTSNIQQKTRESEAELDSLRISSISNDHTKALRKGNGTTDNPPSKKTLLDTAEVGEPRVRFAESPLVAQSNKVGLLTRRVVNISRWANTASPERISRRRNTGLFAPAKPAAGLGIRDYQANLDDGTEEL